MSAPPAGPYRALADDTDTEDDDGSEATDVLGLGLGLDAEQRSMPMPIPYHRRLPDMAHNDYNDFEASYLSSDATQVDTHSRFSVTIQWEASAPYGQESENPAEPWGAPAPQGDPKWKDIALDDDTDTETVDNTDNDEVDDGSEVSVHPRNCRGSAITAKKLLPTAATTCLSPCTRNASSPRTGCAMRA